MNDAVLSSYLQQSVFVSGIAACIPILYMSLETTKCMNDVTADYKNIGNLTSTGIDYQQECGGVLWPQNSVCFFLLAQFMRKVVIAPLTPTIITIDAVMTLNLPNRVKLVGILVIVSGFLNRK